MISGLKIAEALLWVPENYCGVCPKFESPGPDEEIHSCAKKGTDVLVGFLFCPSNYGGEMLFRDILHYVLRLVCPDLDLQQDERWETPRDCKLVGRYGKTFLPPAPLGAKARQGK